MSTKIYNAYKYEGSINDLLKIFLEQKIKVKKKIIKQVTESHMLTLWNRKAFIEENRNKLVDYVALKNLADYIKTVVLDYDHTFSEELSIVVYFPTKDLFEKETYLFQIFGNVRDLNFKKYPEIQDFHFQNQSDEPDDVTEEEWDFREVVWETIFPGFERPSEIGLTYELISPLDASSVAIGVQDNFRKYSNEEIKRNSSKV